MKHLVFPIAALVVLAAAPGQDTVKLPDADFWVVGVWRLPDLRGRHTAKELARITAAEARSDALKHPATWGIRYFTPGTRVEDWMGRPLILVGGVATATAKHGGRPTRQEVRLAVRTHIFKKEYKATRPPKELEHLLGRYYSSKAKPRGRVPATRPSRRPATGS